jgi:Uma2 family endonuclease
VARFLLLLGEHLRDKDIGVVMPEVGFTLKSDPDTVRAPDIAFIRQDRMLSPDTPGFFKGPPDVAVEVLSPDDRPAEIREKVEEYLAHGVPLAVVVDPRQRTVAAHRRLTPPAVAQADADVVDLGDVIADFHCTLRDILG